MRRNARRPPKNLSFVTSLGGHTRPHRYIAHVRAFFWATVISVCAQVLTYILSVYSLDRISGEPLIVAFVALGLPTVLSSMILAAFRRHDAPIISAIAVFGSLFLALVSVLSATRISLSYQSLVFCGLIGLFMACAANYRFHTLSGDKVRLMPFEGAKQIQRQIKGSSILTPEELEHYPKEINFDILLIDERSFHTPDAAEFVSRMHIMGIDVVSYESFLEQINGSVNVAKFELFHIAYTPSQLLYARVKRHFDLAFVVLFSPLLLTISACAALYIYIRDPGPVLFVQIRRGYGNRPFRMYKFRTMFQGTAGGTTVAGDKRVIPGCSIIRKLRIDEVPQCFNILKGDMSLIGPRPSAEYLAKALVKMESKYAYRCVVPPGITGWAQVNSGHIHNLDEELIKLSQDLYYIKRFSIDMDLVILAKTVKTVLFGSGAK